MTKAGPKEVEQTSEEEPTCEGVEGVHMLKEIDYSVKGPMEECVVIVHVPQVVQQQVDQKIVEGPAEECVEIFCVPQGGQQQVDQNIADVPTGECFEKRGHVPKEIVRGAAVPSEGSVAKLAREPRGVRRSAEATPEGPVEKSARVPEVERCASAVQV